MEQLKELSTYFQLVNKVHKENTSICTNCYLYPDKVERLVSQERLYCERTNAGVIFLVDEKEYFEAYYVLSTDKEWNISQKDKDVVVNNIYLKDKKNRKLILLEDSLKKAGFRLQETFGQIECDEQVISGKLKKYSAVANRLMKENGLTLIAPDKESIPQIRELLKNLKTISDYQVPYFEDNEIIEFGKERRFVCVVNSQKEVCAVKFYREENSLYGTIAIKEEYQKAYGIAIALYYDLPSYMTGKAVKPLGWIVTTNTESIKYHMDLGYRWTGRYMDEWILKVD